MESLLEAFNDVSCQAVISDTEGSLQQLYIPLDKLYRINDARLQTARCGTELICVYDPDSEDDVNYDACLLAGIDTEEGEGCIRGLAVILSAVPFRNLTVAEVEEQLLNLEDEM